MHHYRPLESTVASDAFRERAIVALEQRKRVDPATGCWLWTGAKLPTGHGQVRIAVDGVDRCWLTHRIAAFLWLGLDITNRYMGSRKDRSQVNHKPICPNASCFNPDHLYVGTQAENSNDRPPEKRRNQHSDLTLPYICKRGHTVTAETYKKGDGCPECRRLRARKEHDPAVRAWKNAYQREWRKQKAEVTT